MRTNITAVVLPVIGCLLLSAAYAGQDYKEFEDGLNRSAVEVNKFELPDSLYELNQITAEEYFRCYFNDHLMTPALRVNLAYPVFCWNNNCENLQRAIVPVLLENLRMFFRDNRTPHAINKTLAKEDGLHDHIFHTLVFLIDVAKSEILDDAFKLQVQHELLAILRLSDLTDTKYQKIDPERYPYVNALKTQFVMTCFTFCRQLDNLTPLLKSIYLDPPRKKLLEDNRVLVLDNKALDMKQIRCIRDFMNSLPPHAQIPVTIICFGALGSEYNDLITVHSFHCTGSYNIHETRIGAEAKEQFPQDCKPLPADGFSITLVHEHNHQVDSFYVDKQPQLKVFKDLLLKQAGDSKTNYLCSMFEDGFFSKNPHQFAASLADQYFTDSKAMLQYALQKAEDGNLNQINQFVLLASIYSDNKACYFYSIDRRGNLRNKTYPVQKENGLITQLQIGSRKISFVYDNNMISAVNGP